MGSIDGLKEQVEELKQRLKGPSSQHGAEFGELKSRLASIKASLESKQGEITRLTGEKERFVAEVQRLSSENDQLRKMLGEVLSVIGSRPADGSTDFLREFLAETDSLVKAAGGGSGDSQAAGQAIAVPAQPESAGGEVGPAGPQEAAQPGPASQDDGEDDEDSPALRRIMRRGRRAV